MICGQQCVEMIRWGISIVVPALSGLVGVVIGAWLTGRRDRRQRRLAFVEKQLESFYSPMLGLRHEIRMRGKLRLRIHDAADTVWRELCKQAREVSVEALRDLSRDRDTEFKRLIEYDNTRLQDGLLPAYRQMVKLFRENLWLADPDTRAYSQPLIEFVELWARWLAKSIPAEVLECLGHSEKTLQAFYDHLQQRHDALRGRIETGIV